MDQLALYPGLVIICCRASGDNPSTHLFDVGEFELEVLDRQPRKPRNVVAVGREEVAEPAEPLELDVRDLGVFGLVEIVVFVLVLAGGLAYCWKRGALEWD